jgi:hypothetical protein
MTAEADRETLINLLKERPDLLLNLNRAISEVVEAAGIEPGELTLDQILDIAASALVDDDEGRG